MWTLFASTSKKACCQNRSARPKGYRLYPQAIVERLNFIRRAKRLGFSLEEITALLDLQDNGGTKSEVKALTSRKLDEINARITDLESMRDVLQSLNKRCSGRGNVAGCPIIEALADDNGSSAGNPT